MIEPEKEDEIAESFQFFHSLRIHKMQTKFIPKMF